MNRNRAVKDERFVWRCTTMIFGMMLAFIPTCSLYEGLSNYEQPIDVIAPSIKSPCRVLGGAAVGTLVTYAFVWYGISRKRPGVIEIGSLAMMTFMTLTVITQNTIHTVSFESEELSSKRLELSEIQIRHLLETSINGLNGIQRSLKCCGLNNYTDWNSNAIFMCVSPAMSTNSCSIPETCCEDYTANLGDAGRSRLLYMQTTRSREHCGKGALKPIVSLPYEKPEKSNSANNSKDMKNKMIFEDGCLEKAKTFLSDFGTKNLILGGFILLSQVFGVVASIWFLILIRRYRDGESEAQDTPRDRNNDNNQRNGLQPRRNSNADYTSNNFELLEIDPSLHIATDNLSDCESDTETLHLSDTESRSASVNLRDIASQEPAATTNRQHGESRNDAAATNLIDTESVHPTDIESQKPLATANPKHSSIESRNNDAAAATLTATESIERETDDVNPPVFESMNVPEASCSTTDVGSRQNSSESELGVKSSPTYKKISGLFENTAEYKLEESQQLLDAEDRDVEDPAKSYRYDWNEMFFVTTTV